MSWLDRFKTRQVETAADAAEPPPEERSAPGLAVLFGALSSDGGHSILDLGGAEGRRLELLGRFARSVRFAEFVPHPPDGADFDAALGRMGERPGEGYDVVLAWNVFDLLDERQRRRLLDRIVEVTRPGARLHAMADSSGAPATQPVRISLTEMDRMVVEPVGPPQPAYRPLLPRQMEDLLHPFRVVSAFTVRGELREYVVRRVG